MGKRKLHTIIMLIVHYHPGNNADKKKCPSQGFSFAKKRVITTISSNQIEKV